MQVTSWTVLTTPLSRVHPAIAGDQADLEPLGCAKSILYLNSTVWGESDGLPLTLLFVIKATLLNLSQKKVVAAVAADLPLRYLPLLSVLRRLLFNFNYTALL